MKTLGGRGAQDTHSLIAKKMPRGGGFGRRHCFLHSGWDRDCHVVVVSRSMSSRLGHSLDQEMPFANLAF